MKLEASEARVTEIVDDPTSIDLQLELERCFIKPMRPTLIQKERKVKVENDSRSILASKKPRV